MNQFKLKHMNRYQRNKYMLKMAIKNDDGGIVSKIKIQWFRSVLKLIRRNQFLGNNRR